LGAYGLEELEIVPLGHGHLTRQDCVHRFAEPHGAAGILNHK
jgi:hypothetical protein